MLLTITSGLLVYLVLGACVAACTGNFSFGAWLHQLFLVVDQTLNVLLTPFHRSAWADETMSARCWRAYRDGRAWGKVMRPVIDWLFAWQHAPGGHCFRSYQRERERLHLPPEERVTSAAAPLTPDPGDDDHGELAASHSPFPMAAGGRSPDQPS